eukprot:SAG31_NODE_2965_length_4843_cov_7.944140_4_plen_59_part_00
MVPPDLAAATDSGFDPDLLAEIRTVLLQRTPLAHRLNNKEIKIRYGQLHRSAVQQLQL